MALTVSDLNDLRQLLVAHPEWRLELRPLILGQEIESLPEVVRNLAEAQRRTEQRVEELAEAQRRTEQRLEELAEAQRRTEQRVAELAEALQRLEGRFEELAEAQRRTEQRLAELAITVGDLARRVDKLEGRFAQYWGFAQEQKFRSKASSYFGQWIKRPVAADMNDIRDRLEAQLPGDDVSDAMLADLVVQGRSRSEPGGDVFIVVEISSLLIPDDVVRAVRRAALFQKAGLAAVPAVAGEATTLPADEEARKHSVAVVLDGRRLLWQEAAAQWLSP